jgi:hypothetical protein
LWLFVRETIAADRIPHQNLTGRNQRHAIGWKSTHGHWWVADGQSKQ